MSSYEAINYSIRPAKSVERKMIVEASRRLGELGNLSEYQYVGFGSTYFSDFSLVHRALAISHMTSIERDEENRDRFEFNKPFDCIRLMFGESSAVLPELNWDRRAIVWLDYDQKLRASMIADVMFVSSVVSPGSLVLVTVNCQPDSVRMDQLPDPLDLGLEIPTEDTQATRQRVRALEQRLGPDLTPAGLGDADLEGWGLARTSRTIIEEAVRSAIRDRNVRSADLFRFEQLFNFQYSDRARMLTVGYLISDAGQTGAIARCEFRSFDFVRQGSEPYRLRVPSLTFKEIRHLNEQLPLGTAAATAPAVPPADVDQYARIYRHFPSFVDVDL